MIDSAHPGVQVGLPADLRESDNSRTRRRRRPREPAPSASGRATWRHRAALASRLRTRSCLQTNGAAPSASTFKSSRPLYFTIQNLTFFRDDVYQGMYYSAASMHNASMYTLHAYQPTCRSVAGAYTFLALYVSQCGGGCLLH